MFELINSKCEYVIIHDWIGVYDYMASYYPGHWTTVVDTATTLTVVIGEDGETLAIYDYLDNDKDW